MGWVAVATVALFPVTAAARIVVGGAAVTLYGDGALTAIATRRAARFEQLLGPYSRTGVHHPGPAMFYLLAPFVDLARSVSSGLYLGALAINLAALVTIVAVVWRRAGPPAALAAAVALDLFVVCLGPGTLREPWNPYLVVVPMVAFVVLWAAADPRTDPRTDLRTGQGAGVWAAVVGSYEMQTHLATVPVVVALLAALLVRWRRHGHGRPGRAALAGVVALVAMWVPPVVEGLRDRPNNLQA
ncbi:MAG TPA: hypothetical protein VFP61_06380, partial [Acidimicrobiales bacterium]|nr:hypothetical protein [Acidimicrobiales bacterium]